MVPHKLHVYDLSLVSPVYVLSGVMVDTTTVFEEVKTCKQKYTYHYCHEYSTKKHT